MRFLCRIGWHSWGKWSDNYDATISDIKYKIQSRRCSFCIKNNWRDAQAKICDGLKIHQNNQWLYINNVLLHNSNLQDSKHLLESELRIIKNELIDHKAQCEKLASELKTIYKILDDKIAPIPCEGSVYHLADEEFVLVLHCRNNAEQALAEYEAWKKATDKIE